MYYCYLEIPEEPVTSGYIFETTRIFLLLCAKCKGEDLTNFSVVVSFYAAMKTWKVSCRIHEFLGAAVNFSCVTAS